MPGAHAHRASQVSSRARCIPQRSAVKGQTRRGRVEESRTVRREGSGVLKGRGRRREGVGLEGQGPESISSLIGWKYLFLEASWFRTELRAGQGLFRSRLPVGGGLRSAVVTGLAGGVDGSLGAISRYPAKQRRKRNTEVHTRAHTQ
eukprot:2726807-Rhodomonas_salina.2